MVKYGAWLVFFLLASAGNSYAAGFSARLEGSAAGGNEGLNLRLELSDVNATAQPDLSEVEKSFQVLAGQTESISKNINGVSSFSTVWNFTLASTRPGQNLIPPITVATTDGELKTQAIAIQVTQAAPAHSGLPTENGVSFIGKSNKSELYKNEPVLVGYRLTSTRSLRNIQVGEFSVKDAIVERQGQPKTQTEIVNGRERQVLLISYLVTPMKDGVLTIPPLTLQGEILALRTSTPNRPGRTFPGSGGDEDGPFAQMNKMMEAFGPEMEMFGGFSRMKPVTLTSNAINLKILASVAGMDPWLPTTNLKLSQSWSGDKPRAGEPLTRTIITKADGLAASELPGFQSQMSSNNDYKVYSDQPELTTKQEHGQIVSIRKDVFTIIPQRAGDIRLPAVKLTWWDTNRRSPRVASVPEGVVHVLPGSSSIATTVTSPGAEKSKFAQSPPASPGLPAPKPYAWLVMCALFPLFFISLVFSIRRYFLKNSKGIIAPQIENSKTVKPPDKKDLEKCATVNDVHRFIRMYSKARWGANVNSSLSKIFDSAQMKESGFDVTKGRELSNRIEGALYAGKSVDLEELRSDTADLIFQKPRASAQMRKSEVLPALNPT